MNLSNYHPERPTPSSDNIQKLINSANTYGATDFNIEAVRLMGQWHTDVSDYKQLIEEPEQQVLLKLWQIDNNPIARPVTTTNALEVVSVDDEPREIRVTSIVDLGMITLGYTAGLIFVTDGDLNMDMNEGLLVPVSHATQLRVSAHLIVSS